uniref:Uncharacterized protein n=1 Tax=Colletotrichum scovillei TaxID=1209932 RepID=A0A9P7UBS9_9PEZI
MTYLSSAVVSSDEAMALLSFRLSRGVLAALREATGSFEIHDAAGTTGFIRQVCL